MHYSDCSDKSGATNVGSLAHSLLLQTSTNRENHGQLHSKVADMKFNVHLGHLTLNFMWEWLDLVYVVFLLSSTQCLESNLPFMKHWEWKLLICLNHL